MSLPTKQLRLQYLYQMLIQVMIYVVDGLQIPGIVDENELINFTFSVINRLYVNKLSNQDMLNFQRNVTKEMKNLQKNFEN